ncbi:MAG TPA: RNA polymerase sigma factor, partial [Chryseosolibacter sp.]|nr:RNA polymerase sigma factor [Chryseosolibacter sp.]
MRWLRNSRASSPIGCNQNGYLALYASMTPQQDRKLLESIQADPSQFGIVFDQLYRPVFGYVYRRVMNYDIARDISSETFLKAFLGIGKFRWTGVSISAWIFRIATNEVNYFFRKQRYTPRTTDRILDQKSITLYDHGLDDRDLLEQELKMHDEFVRVSAALSTLDIKYQEVIALRYFENKDNGEISSILGKPEGTVKSLLSRGLGKLRNLVIAHVTRNDSISTLNSKA